MDDGEGGGIPCHVLVVEDDNLQLDLLQVFLKACRCEPMPAKSLAEAIELMDGAVKPDAAVVDYHLQHNETGLMVIHELRQRCGDQTPAVILTADVSPETRQGIIASQVLLLNKPFDVGRLYSIVMAMCNRDAPAAGRTTH